MYRWVMLVVLMVLIGTIGLGQQISRSPIVIRTDWDFTPKNGVVGGSGTASDPFVIAGWRIDRIGVDFGILIEGTTRPFVIRDVEICGAKVAGIKLHSVRNGRIENALVEGSTTGVMIFFSQEIELHSTRIEECSDGIRAFYSTNLNFSKLTVAKSTVGIWFTGTTNSSICDSRIISCDLGIKLELASTGNTILNNAFFGCRIPAQSEGGNRWDDGSRGNFWQGFSAPDKNQDGIFDYPYPIGLDEDRFPLVFPPEEREQ